MNESVLTCPAENDCRGCDHLGIPLKVQAATKIRELSNLLNARGIAAPSIGFLSPGHGGLRDRLDFSLENGRFGLFHKTRPEIHDLAQCPQLSHRLEAWMKTFRLNLPKVRKGSVRLRIAPDGTRGMWLDFANIDTKSLLDEKTWLATWPESVIIEMGQKKKRVERRGSSIKLVDHYLFPWFVTRFGEKKVPLFGFVGSFTQPSLAANELITDWIQTRVSASRPERIVEFGSGQGNLSFPALASGAQLVACESDRGALDGFRKSLDVLAADGNDLRPKVRVEAGDFLRKPSADIGHADFLLVNPPRSGLGLFLEPVARAAGLRHVLYMSCNPKTFATDAQRLRDDGFEISELSILDQFPQTKHFEVLSLWRRSISEKSV